jgi:hypothetical protein
MAGRIPGGMEAALNSVQMNLSPGAKTLAFAPAELCAEDNAATGEADSFGIAGIFLP